MGRISQGRHQWIEFAEILWYQRFLLVTTNIKPKHRILQYGRIYDALAVFLLFDSVQEIVLPARLLLSRLE